MQLGRYQVSTLQPTTVHSVNFSQDGGHFAVASDTGYEVWRTWPLALARRRVLPGSIARAVIVPSSPLLVLQGGGTSPVYPPNKAIIYHDGIGRAIAELEFGEMIRGIAVRQGLVCVILTRRAIAFKFGISQSGPLSRTDLKGKGKSSESGFWLEEAGEWDTADNPNGLFALSNAPQSSLLALPGRQIGHVQLIYLPQTTSSKPAPYRSPIILAHTHALSSLSCSAEGTELITTSERGTLLRIWDTTRGSLLGELRRGVDRAEMWGVTLEPGSASSSNSQKSQAPPVDGDSGSSSGGRVVGWSDKGTIHIWDTTPENAPSKPTLTHILSRNLPLPRYFSSRASLAQYHLPRKNPHAFSSAMGAAAGAAGVPSAKLKAEFDELSEKFIVGWVDVEVHPDIHPASIAPSKSATQEKDQVRMRSAGGSPSMSTRGRRRSFGSDITSRTATPATASPIMGEREKRVHLRGTSATRSTTQTPTKDARATRGRGIGKSGTRMEKQLVAITYSGDWYRLRIPDLPAPEEEGEKGRTKCELVEYRRLKVGGGGW